MASPVLDNLTLRDYACYVLSGATSPNNSYQQFLEKKLHQDPTFEVMRETITLCEALVEAVEADLAFADYRAKVTSSFLRIKVDMKKLEELRAIREEKFGDYEMLHKLVASGNFYLKLTRS